MISITSTEGVRMTISLKKTGACIVAVATTAGLAACGSASSAGGKDVYTIGVVVPLSGAQAVYGNQVRDAVALAIKHVNKAGTIKGKLQAKYVDSQGDPAKAVSGFNQAVSVNKAVVVESQLSSSIKAEAPVAGRLKIPLFNPSASSSDLAGLTPYLINLAPLADAQIKALLPYAATQGIKKIAVVYSDETVGQSLNATIKSLAPADGLTVVDSVAVPFDGSDFQSTVNKLKRQDFDSIFIAMGNAGDVPTLVKQASAAGINTKYLTYNGVPAPDLMKLPAAAGMLWTALQVDTANPVNTATTDYAKEFSASYKDAPAAYQATVYNSVLITAEAIAKLEKAGTKVSGESVQKEIYGTGTFDVVGGSVAIKSDGTTLSPLAVLELKGGQPTTVQKVSAAN